MTLCCLLELALNHKTPGIHLRHHGGFVSLPEAYRDSMLRAMQKILPTLIKRKLLGFGLARSAVSLSLILSIVALVAATQVRPTTSRVLGVSTKTTANTAPSTRNASPSAALVKVAPAQTLAVATANGSTRRADTNSSTVKVVSAREIASPSATPRITPGPTPTPEPTVVSTSACYVLVPPTPGENNVDEYYIYVIQAMSDGTTNVTQDTVDIGAVPKDPQCGENEPPQLN
jgi:hypothetical protein